MHKYCEYSKCHGHGYILWSPLSQVADVFLEGVANNCALHAHRSHSVKIPGVGSYSYTDGFQFQNMMAPNTVFHREVIRLSKFESYLAR